MAVSAEADIKCEVEMRRVTGLFSLLCQMADLRQLKMFDWSIKKKKHKNPKGATRMLVSIQECTMYKNDLTLSLGNG